jgi:hypothetical protein
MRDQILNVAIGQMRHREDALVNHDQAAAFVADQIRTGNAARRAASEEALWHFPPDRSSVQVRKLLERRDFVVQHPEIASRLLTRAAQSGTAGLDADSMQALTRESNYSECTFVFPPGHGIMLHRGTWHDFPMAIDRPVTVLTANSEEVIAALTSQKDPDEMDRGDVYKIDMVRRTGKQLRVAL